MFAFKYRNRQIESTFYILCIERKYTHRQYPSNLLLRFINTVPQSTNYTTEAQLQINVHRIYSRLRHETPNLLLRATAIPKNNVFQQIVC